MQPRNWFLNTHRYLRTDIEPNLTGDSLPGLRGHTSDAARALAVALAAGPPPIPSVINPGNNATANEILLFWAFAGVLKRAWEYPSLLEQFCADPSGYLDGSLDLVGLVAGRPVRDLATNANLDRMVSPKLWPPPAWTACVKESELRPVNNALANLLQRLYANYSMVVSQDCK